MLRYRATTRARRILSRCFILRLDLLFEFSNIDSRFLPALYLSFRFRVLLIAVESNVRLDLFSLENGRKQRDIRLVKCKKVFQAFLF